MLITNNAYLILGLSSDASEKQINKRYKEMLNLLNIDEVPDYDVDISFLNYKKIRTEDAIKGAFNQLTNQKKKVYQSFFWFDIVDKIDEKAFELFKKGEIIEALDIWKDEYSGKLKGRYLKNYLVADLLLLENCKQFEKDFDFKHDISVISKGYKELIDSDKFWNEFEKNYNINNDIQLTKEHLKTFREELPQYMVEAIFDISEDIKKQSFYKKFSSVFGLVAQELDDNKNVTDEIDLIKKKFEEIKELKLDGDDLDEVIDGINEIEEAINRLVNLGLGENLKLKKLRDKVATEILSMAISLGNDYDDLDNCENFLEEAKVIAAGTVVIKRIEENQKNLSGLKQGKKNAAKIKEDLDEIKELLERIDKTSSVSKIRSCYDSLVAIMDRIEDENGSEGLDTIYDMIAAMFVKSALYFNNTEKSYGKALEVIEMAEHFARGYEVKNNISQNKYILKQNKETSSNNVLYWILRIIGFIIFCIIAAAVKS